MYFRIWFQIIQIYHTVNNTDCQFKVLLANYFCFNFSKFPPKKSQVANEKKNRSLMHGNSRAKQVILEQR